MYSEVITSQSLPNLPQAHASRKLGYIEKLFADLHDFGAMIDVTVARIEGSLTPEILQQALDLVQKRHPMLQVHIVKSTDGFYFQSEGTLKIPLQVLDKENENQWLNIAEDELHQKFPHDATPLCRVTFLRSSEINAISEIIATFHHSIVDGVSCLYFFNDLLSYCQELAENRFISEVVSMPLLPSVENLIDQNFTQNNNVEQTSKKLTEEMPTPKLIIEQEAPASQRRTCVIPRNLSKELTQDLIKRCQQEATTVHGALCAAMLFAAAKFASTNTPIHLSCNTAINLRKYCQPVVSNDYMGFLVNNVNEIHTLDKNTSFWHLARECKSKISLYMSSSTCISKIHNRRLENIDREKYVNLFEHNMGRKATVSISNLGKHDILNKHDVFQLKELYFATGQHLIGSCFWLGSVTFHEQLFCSFVHVTPLISRKTGEFLVDSFITALVKACSSEQFTIN